MKSFLRHFVFVCQPKKVQEKQPLSLKKILTLMVSIFFLQVSAKAQQYHTYHNADSANPILNATPKPQNIIGMQFFDVDGDKDLDCYIMLAGNKLVLYHNVGTTTRPEYQLADSTGLEGITLPATQFAQHFYFFDMDNDGDKDLFIESQYTSNVHSDANYSYITTFLNDGTARKPHFTTTSFNPVGFLTSGEVSNYVFFTFQDIDGDGDMDFAYSANLKNGSSPSIYTYLNTNVGGNATFTFQPYGTETISNTESFYDFSGDGLPDLLLSNGVNFTSYFPNIGTATNPQVNIYHYSNDTVVPAPQFGNIAAVSIVDLNKDGQIEVFNNTGNYETDVPVPVLKQSTVKFQGQNVTRLTATTQLPGYQYQWEYNGKKVAGYNKPYADVRKPGKYVLYITDTLGTGISLPYTTSPKADIANANREVIASIKPATQALSVKVYPNPFRESINLTITGGNGAATKTIRVTDMAGKIWLTQTTSSSTIQIGSALPKGLYNLEVWENNSLAYHTKIVKQ